MQRTPFASLTPAPPDNLLRPAIAELVSCGPSCPRLVNVKEGPSDISYRVTKRSSDRTLARPPCLQVPRWHPRVAKGSSDRSSTRPPCLQVPRWHPRVAKGSSDRSSTRPPCLQVPQSHPRVTKGGFLPVFGTATLPTGASVPSPRGHCELVYRIVALLSFVKFTWHEPLLIIK